MVLWVRGLSETATNRPRNARTPWTLVSDLSVNPSRSGQDGTVTFRYRDAKTGKAATLSLAVEDFLWLLVQHVLPNGFQHARNFGFLHHNCRRSLHLRQLLHLHTSAAQASEQPPAKRRALALCRGRGDGVVEAVPTCSAPQTERPNKKVGPVQVSTL